MAVEVLLSELDTVRSYYENHNYEHNVFSKLSNVIRAIKSKGLIADLNGQPIDIAIQIMEPNYRFVTYDNPTLSRDTSEALATAIELAKQVGASEERESNVRPHERSIEVRAKKADDFALKMKQKIDQLKSEDNISTYRDIVEALNQRGIPTAQGSGKWHLKTVQDILKRAKTIEEGGYSR